MKQTTPYVIFKCSDTLALCVEAARDGLESWVPVVNKVTRQPKTGKTLTTRQAAVPGYIFIPLRRMDSFKLWCETRDVSVTVILHSTGPDPHNTELEHTMAKRPATVLPDVLEVLQASCILHNASETTPTYQKGDHIKILMGLGEGNEGVVHTVRNNSLRVLVGTKYIGVPLHFVEKLS